MASPRISVVVPVYNVEAFLAPCLDSLAAQTFADFEAVMVDDGSTDRSAAIAGEYARRDARFRLLTQANGGLSRARNVGVGAARGQFLAFLDSDDLLPRTAHERLLGALDATGSDFAAGDVLQLTRGETTRAAWLSETFRRDRLATHVTAFPPLLADRTVWNKLWRRSFWDAHGFRFPEGAVHEDIPVVLPAYVLAGSVDVLAEPVYVYRTREGGERSITQRRLEPQVLLDRLAAIEHVRDVLRQHGLDELLRSYDARLLTDDLMLHVNVLDAADAGYRALFLDRVGALLADAPPELDRGLPLGPRVKWRLVRRRRIGLLVALLRARRAALWLRGGLTHRLPPSLRGRLRRLVRDAMRKTARHA
jgi:glycosyltransferase involved in cell wall biosynthesis